MVRGPTAINRAKVSALVVSTRCVANRATRCVPKNWQFVMSFVVLRRPLRGAGILNRLLMQAWAGRRVRGRRTRCFEIPLHRVSIKQSSRLFNVFATNLDLLDFWPAVELSVMEGNPSSFLCASGIRSTSRTWVHALYYSERSGQRRFKR